MINQNLYACLQKLQTLVVPKNLVNSLGQYKYRSSEVILEAIKPVLAEFGCICCFDDDIVVVGNEKFFKSTVKIIDNFNGCVSSTGWAELEINELNTAEREASLAKMTGSACTYAHKYALNALLCLDDTRVDSVVDDPDFSGKTLTPIEDVKPERAKRTRKQQQDKPAAEVKDAKQEQDAQPEEVKEPASTEPAEMTPKIEDAIKPSADAAPDEAPSQEVASQEAATEENTVFDKPELTPGCPLWNKYVVATAQYSKDDVDELARKVSEKVKCSPENFRQLLTEAGRGYLIN